MSEALALLQRWYNRLTAPAAEFTVDQIRQIAVDNAGLRESRAGSAGFLIAAEPARFLVYWPPGTEFADLYVVRAENAFRATGYRANVQVVSHLGQSALAIGRPPGDDVNEPPGTGGQSSH